MSKSQILLLVVLAAVMVALAMFFGNWSEQLNPDGIAPHAVANKDVAVEQVAPRDAYRFGASMGLLVCALAYCCAAFGLVINARSKGKTINRFTYGVGALAALAFALSYLVDDYFY